MENNHVNPVLSGLVILAAIATTFTTYASYNDVKVAAQYEEAGDSMNQAASAMLSYRLEKAAEVVATTTEAVPELE